MTNQKRQDAVAILHPPSAHFTFDTSVTTLPRPMKAERRHELQQNTLDRALTRAPDAARKYGGTVLLIVLAAVVGYMLIRYRISSTRDANRVATENLATARTNINQLSRLHLYPVPIPSQTIAEFRKNWSNDARTAIDSVTGSVSDPTLLA